MADLAAESVHVCGECRHRRRRHAALSFWHARAHVLAHCGLLQPQRLLELGSACQCVQHFSSASGGASPPVAQSPGSRDHCEALLADKEQLQATPDAKRNCNQLSTTPTAPNNEMSPEVHTMQASSAGMRSCSRSNSSDGSMSGSSECSELGTNNAYLAPPHRNGLVSALLDAPALQLLDAVLHEELQSIGSDAASKQVGSHSIYVASRSIAAVVLDDVHVIHRAMRAVRSFVQGQRPDLDEPLPTTHMRSTSGSVILP
jgi:hypothetical protein